MREKELFELVIDEPDNAIYIEAKNRFDTLAKPIDGFGYMEDIICRTASIQRKLIPDVSKKALIVMCADSGVVEEGISQTDSSVTSAVARLLGEGKSTVGIMTGDFGITVIPVDIGINTPDMLPGVKNRKVSKGTRNIAKYAAMTKEQCLLAVFGGMEVVKECAGSGFGMIATGEMGIGNTTAASALLCALTGDEPSSVAGRGAGLSDEGLARKIKVIEEALKIHGYEERGKAITSGQDVLRALCRVGGLDMAGLVGVYIGCALHHIPVVIDGVTCAVAALAASYIAPASRSYMIASHRGREKGLARVLDILGLRAVIDADMALGEGTGAVMLFPLIDMVMSVYTNGQLFKQVGIREYKRFGK